MYSMLKNYLAEDIYDRSKIYNMHNKCYVRTSNMSLSMRKSDCVLTRNYTCAYACVR